MGVIDRRKRVRTLRRGYAERGYCPRCLPFQFFDHAGSDNAEHHSRRDGWRNQRASLGKDAQLS
jgi:hypothetical protein